MGIALPQRTSSGTTMIPINSLSLEKRTIWIEDEITQESSNEFIKQIIELNRQSIGEPIKVLINSMGGSVIHGLAMYDIMTTSKAPVETYCVGTAYSMAALLFAAGSRRYMLEHSKLMLHEPLISQGAGGSASSVKSMSDSLQNTKKQLNEILCRHTGKNAKEMNKAVAYDHYFDSAEAIKFGLADEVVGLEKML